MSIANKTTAEPLAKGTMVVGVPPKPKGRPKPGQKSEKPKKRSTMAGVKK